MTALRPPAPRVSYREAPARRRLVTLLDPGSFRETLGPAERVRSPHLAALGMPGAFDDGVIVGAGRLGGRAVLAASQEGGFMGGAVGEVHGAKLLGLLRRALREPTAGVLLLADSGGVRLQEANAGLVAISEVMRGVLAVRGAGIPVIALVGGGWGCFGGMGIVARCCDAIVMSEEARLGISGPDVIEATRGVEELDSADRALVWRTYGGKHRYLLCEADRLVEDDVAELRAAALELLDAPRPLSLEALGREHEHLARRLRDFGGCDDASDVWRAAGIRNPERLPVLDAGAFREAVAAARRGDR
jgi:malonate decarboxylase beta subunit